MIKAFETTGTITGAHQLTLDDDLPAKGTVRVIVLMPEETDIPEKTWLHAAVTNRAFDFLHAPEEDVYTLKDGRPFHDEG